jgi:hypothetical protein
VFVRLVNSGGATNLLKTLAAGKRRNGTVRTPGNTRR